MDNQTPQNNSDQSVQIGSIKVSVDKNTCNGCATCVGIAPTTFELGSDGKSQVKAGSTDTPETIKLAAQSCPTNSIKIETV